MGINLKKIILNSFLAIALLFNLASLRVFAHCIDDCTCKKHCPQEMKQRMDEIFAEIGVSIEQRQKIDTIMQDSRTKEQLVHKCMHEKKKTLMQYLTDSQATKAQALIYTKEISCLHNQLSEIRIDSIFEVKKILTPQQQQKMAEYHKKHSEFQKSHTCPMGSGQ